MMWLAQQWMARAEAWWAAERAAAANRKAERAWRYRCHRDARWKR